MNGEDCFGRRRSAEILAFLGAALVISAGAAVFSLPASHSQIERAELRSADSGLGPSTSCRQPQRTELVGPIWGGVYQACLELTATASLENGEVVLRAGETVRIGSGFRVAPGVRLRIEVGGAPKDDRPPPISATPQARAAAAPLPAGLVSRAGFGAFLSSILSLPQELATQRAASESGPTLFYDYYDRQIPLALVRSQLAVRFDVGHLSDRPGRESSLQELMPGWGVADRFGEWTLFSTQEASGTDRLAAGVDVIEAMERIRGV